MRTWWPVLALLGAGWSLWGWFVGRVEADPWHLLPLSAAAWLLLQRTPQARRDAPSGGALCAVLAFAVGSPFLPPLLAATLLASSLTLVASERFFRRRLQPGLGALLLLSLPTLPALQLVVGYPLRVVSASIAAALLRAGGAPAERAGTILQVDAELYAIDAPCSGISMWWTALLIVAWLAARERVSCGRALLGAAVATGVVLLGNGLRSASLVWLERSRVPVPEWAHEAVGAAAFALCVAALVFVLGRAREVRSCVAR